MDMIVDLETGNVIAIHKDVVLIRNFSPHLEPEDAVLYAERFGERLDSLLSDFQAATLTDPHKDSESPLDGNLERI